jgi:excisionase family DNA binding protein
MNETVLSREQVRDLLGVSLPLVDRLLLSGELRHARLGRRVLIPREAVDMWLRRRTTMDVDRPLKAETTA